MGYDFFDAGCGLVGYDYFDAGCGFSALNILITRQNISSETNDNFVV